MSKEADYSLIRLRLDEVHTAQYQTAMLQHTDDGSYLVCSPDNKIKLNSDIPLDKAIDKAIVANYRQSRFEQVKLEDVFERTLQQSNTRRRVIVEPLLLEVESYQIASQSVVKDEQIDYLLKVIKLAQMGEAFDWRMTKKSPIQLEVYCEVLRKHKAKNAEAQKFIDELKPALDSIDTPDKAFKAFSQLVDIYLQAAKVQQQVENEVACLRMLVFQINLGQSLEWLCAQARFITLSAFKKYFNQFAPDEIQPDIFLKMKMAVQKFLQQYYIEATEEEIDTYIYYNFFSMHLQKTAAEVTEQVVRHVEVWQIQDEQGIRYKHINFDRQVHTYDTQAALELALNATYQEGWVAQSENSLRYFFRGVANQAAIVAQEVQRLENFALLAKAGSRLDEIFPQIKNISPEAYQQFFHGYAKQALEDERFRQVVDLCAAMKDPVDQIWYSHSLVRQLFNQYAAAKNVVDEVAFLFDAARLAQRGFLAENLQTFLDKMQDDSYAKCLWQLAEVHLLSDSLLQRLQAGENPKEIYQDYLIKFANQFSTEVYQLLGLAVRAQAGESLKPLLESAKGLHEKSYQAFLRFFDDNEALDIADDYEATCAALKAFHEKYKSKLLVDQVQLLVNINILAKRGIKLDGVEKRKYQVSEQAYASYFTRSDVEPSHQSFCQVLTLTSQKFDLTLSGFLAQILQQAPSRDGRMFWYLLGATTALGLAAKAASYDWQQWLPATETVQSASRVATNVILPYLFMQQVGVAAFPAMLLSQVFAATIAYASSMRDVAVLSNGAADALYADRNNPYNVTLTPGTDSVISTVKLNGNSSLPIGLEQNIVPTLVQTQTITGLQNIALLNNTNIAVATTNQINVYDSLFNLQYTCNLSGSVAAVAQFVSDNIFYAATGINGLQVFSASGGSPLATYAGNIVSVAVDNLCVYAADATTNKITIYNKSDFSVNGQISLTAVPSKIFLQGKTLYVIAGNAAKAYDVTNAASASLLGTVTMPAPVDICAVTDYGFIVDQSGLLYVVKTQGQTMQIANFINFNTKDNAYSISSVNVSPDNATLYLTRSDGKVIAYEISFLPELREIGEIAVSANPSQVVVDNLGHLYSGSLTGQKIDQVNINKRSLVGSPEELDINYGSLQPLLQQTFSGTANRLISFGSYYLLGYSQGFLIYDASLQLVGSYFNAAGVYDITPLQDGQTIALTLHTPVFGVVSLSNISVPNAFLFVGTVQKVMGVLAIGPSQVALVTMPGNVMVYNRTAPGTFTRTVNINIPSTQLNTLCYTSDDSLYVGGNVSTTGVGKLCKVSNVLGTAAVSNTITLPAAVTRIAATADEKYLVATCSNGGFSIVRTSDFAVVASLENIATAANDVVVTGASNGGYFFTVSTTSGTYKYYFNPDLLPQISPIITAASLPISSAAFFNGTTQVLAGAGSLGVYDISQQQAQIKQTDGELDVEVIGSHGEVDPLSLRSAVSLGYTPIVASQNYSLGALSTINCGQVVGGWLTVKLTFSDANIVANFQTYSDVTQENLGNGVWRLKSTGLDSTHLNQVLANVQVQSTAQTLSVGVEASSGVPDSTPIQQTLQNFTAVHTLGFSVTNTVATGVSRDIISFGNFASITTAPGATQATALLTINATQWQAAQITNFTCSAIGSAVITFPQTGQMQIQGTPADVESALNTLQLRAANADFSGNIDVDIKVHDNANGDNYILDQQVTAQATAAPYTTPTISAATQTSIESLLNATIAGGAATFDLTGLMVDAQDRALTYTILNPNPRNGITASINGNQLTLNSDAQYGSGAVQLQIQVSNGNQVTTFTLQAALQSPAPALNYTPLATSQNYSLGALSTINCGQVVGGWLTVKLTFSDANIIANFQTYADVTTIALGNGVWQLASTGLDSTHLNQVLANVQVQSTEQTLSVGVEASSGVPDSTPIQQTLQNFTAVHTLNFSVSNAVATGVSRDIISFGNFASITTASGATQATALLTIPIAQWQAAQVTNFSCNAIGSVTVTFPQAGQMQIQGAPADVESALNTLQLRAANADFSGNIDVDIKVRDNANGDNYILDQQVTAQATAAPYTTPNISAATQTSIESLISATTAGGAATFDLTGLMVDAQDRALTYTILNPNPRNGITASINGNQLTLNSDAQYGSGTVALQIQVSNGNQVATFTLQGALQSPAPALNYTPIATSQNYSLGALSTINCGQVTGGWLTVKLTFSDANIIANFQSYSDVTQENLGNGVWRLKSTGLDSTHLNQVLANVQVQSTAQTLSVGVEASSGVPDSTPIQQTLQNFTAVHTLGFSVTNTVATGVSRDIISFGNFASITTAPAATQATALLTISATQWQAAQVTNFSCTAIGSAVITFPQTGQMQIQGAPADVESALNTLQLRAANADFSGNIDVDIKVRDNANGDNYILDQQVTAQATAAPYTTPTISAATQTSIESLISATTAGGIATFDLSGLMVDAQDRALTYTILNPNPRNGISAIINGNQLTLNSDPQYGSGAVQLQIQVSNGNQVTTFTLQGALQSPAPALNYTPIVASQNYSLGALSTINCGQVTGGWVTVTLTFSDANIVANFQNYSDVTRENLGNGVWRLKSTGLDSTHLNQVLANVQVQSTAQTLSVGVQANSGVPGSAAIQQTLQNFTAVHTLGFTVANTNAIVSGISGNVISFGNFASITTAPGATQVTALLTINAAQWQAAQITGFTCRTISGVVITFPQTSQMQIQGSPDNVENALNTLQFRATNGDFSGDIDVDIKVHDNANGDDYIVEEQVKARLNSAPYTMPSIASTVKTRIEAQINATHAGGTATYDLTGLVVDQQGRDITYAVLTPIPRDGISASITGNQLAITSDGTSGGMGPGPVELFIEASNGGKSFTFWLQGTLQLSTAPLVFTSPSTASNYTIGETSILNCGRISGGSANMILQFSDPLIQVTFPRYASGQAVTINNLGNGRWQLINLNAYQPTNINDVLSSVAVKSNVENLTATVSIGNQATGTTPQQVAVMSFASQHKLALQIHSNQYVGVAGNTIAFSNFATLTTASGATSATAFLNIDVELMQAAQINLFTCNALNGARVTFPQSGQIRVDGTPAAVLASVNTLRVKAANLAFAGDVAIDLAIRTDVDGDYQVDETFFVQMQSVPDPDLTINQAQLATINRGISAMSPNGMVPFNITGLVIASTGENVYYFLVTQPESGMNATLVDDLLTVRANRSGPVIFDVAASARASIVYIAINGTVHNIPTSNNGTNVSSVDHPTLSSLSQLLLGLCSGGAIAIAVAALCCCRKRLPCFSVPSGSASVSASSDVSSHSSEEADHEAGAKDLLNQTGDTLIYLEPLDSPSSVPLKGETGGSIPPSPLAISPIASRPDQDGAQPVATKFKWVEPVAGSVHVPARLLKPLEHNLEHLSRHPEIKPDRLSLAMLYSRMQQRRSFLDTHLQEMRPVSPLDPDLLPTAETVDDIATVRPCARRLFLEPIATRTSQQLPGAVAAEEDNLEVEAIEAHSNRVAPQ